MFFFNIFKGYTLYAPGVLLDGNTMAWFDMAESYMTKDGSDRISQWTDKSGNDNHLLQAGIDSIKPTWSADGVLFDGVDDYLRSASFTLEQPEMIYMVVKPVAWTADDYISDGHNSNGGMIYQKTITPNIAAFAGAFSTENVNLLVGSYAIIKVLFNGASSKLQVNETAETTGNFGAADMGGFTLGSKAVATNFGNIEVKEVIIRKIEDAALDEAAIYAYLKAKYLL